MAILVLINIFKNNFKLHRYVQIFNANKLFKRQKTGFLILH